MEDRREVTTETQRAQRNSSGGGFDLAEFPARSKSFARSRQDSGPIVVSRLDQKDPSVCSVSPW